MMLLKKLLELTRYQAQEELRSRNLPTGGLKDELVTRLQEVLEV